MTTPLPDAATPAEAEWRRRVVAALKGRSIDTLRSASFEGLEVEPLYQGVTEDRPRALRQAPGRWHVAQRMDQPEPAAANEAALRDLENGADALVLVTPEATAARGFGVAIGGLDDLDRALAGVELDFIGLRLDAGHRALEVGGWLGDVAHRRRLTAAALRIDVAYDPIGCFARTGRLDEPPAAIGRAAATAAAQLRDSGVAGHIFLADGRPYHEAGAGEAQELAAVLATGVAYLRLLTDAGMALKVARENIAVLLAADADAFFTLAKFRAMRRLWARIEAAAALDPKPLALHAETSWRMMSRRDAAVNMLRATAGVFGAGLGGADTICALPHTLPLGLPDAHARRIARNGQLILLDEAHLDVVSDPAGGAGGLEALTEALCERAWPLFQAIEAKGGMIAALEAGLPQEEIAATRDARAAAIATGRSPITGTSAFPNLAEQAPRVLVAAPELRPGVVLDAADITCAPLVGVRDAEAFESLRALAEGGSGPTMFLGNLGTRADFAARATFAINFFAAGGIEALTNAGFETTDDVAAAFRDSGARMACVCAADALDADALGATVAALRQAGGTRIYYAGRPGVREKALRAMGFDGFIFAGCHILTLLDDVLAATTTP